MARRKSDSPRSRGERRRIPSGRGDGVVIWRKKHSAGSRGGFSLRLEPRNTWAIDFDARKLLHRIRVALAEHFRDSLLSGKQPDGSPLPPGYGVRTGWMARNWLLDPIRGSADQASTALHPNPAGGRDEIIEKAIAQGYDFQGVTAESIRVVERAVQAWLHDAFPAGGDGVGTEASPNVAGGALTRFNR
jgi:hypothetical protein